LNLNGLRLRLLLLNNGLFLKLLNLNRLFSRLSRLVMVRLVLLYEFLRDDLLVLLNLLLRDGS
jgi:hypothetical protein